MKINATERQKRLAESRRVWASLSKRRLQTIESGLIGERDNPESDTSFVDARIRLVREIIRS